MASVPPTCDTGDYEGLQFAGRRLASCTASIKMLGTPPGHDEYVEAHFPGTRDSVGADLLNFGLALAVGSALRQSPCHAIAGRQQRDGAEKNEQMDDHLDENRRNIGDEMKLFGDETGYG